MRALRVALFLALLAEAMRDVLDVDGDVRLGCHVGHSLPARPVILRCPSAARASKDRPRSPSERASGTARAVAHAISGSPEIAK